MQFGWINLFNAAIVALILLPNVIYAVRHRHEKSSETNIPRYLTVCEQIGRYGCIALMGLPVFVGKFGFSSAAELDVYFILNAVLLIAYDVLWVRYGKKKSYGDGMKLSVIPAVIFIVCGILLRHWSLVAAAFLFGAAHVKITQLTHQSKIQI